MHEMGIISGVLDATNKSAHEANANKVLAVNLVVGEMTEAIIESLEFAFEALTEDDPFYDGCTLDIRMVSPKSMCLDCGCEFKHDRFHVLCPECGSAITKLLEGRELYIDSIEVDTDD